MNKTVIKKIEFTPEEKKEIDNISKELPTPKTKIITNKAGYSYEYTTNKRFSYERGRKRLKELYGGICTSCAQWPNYIISYDVGGAQLIERYCQECYDKRQQRINK